jgi:hypothetical protein
LTSDKVESVLQDLHVNKGSGPDGIPPIRTVHLLSQNHYLFFLTSLWQLAFFSTSGWFHTLWNLTEESNVYQSTWLHEDPIDYIFRAEIN